MIESLIRFFLEYDHPPSGSTPRLAATCGDLRGEEQLQRWSDARFDALWRLRFRGESAARMLAARQMAWRRRQR